MRRFSWYLVPPVPLESLTRQVLPCCLQDITFHPHKHSFCARIWTHLFCVATFVHTPKFHDFLSLRLSPYTGKRDPCLQGGSSGGRSGLPCPLPHPPTRYRPSRLHDLSCHMERYGDLLCFILRFQNLLPGLSQLHVCDFGEILNLEIVNPETLSV